MNYVYQTVFHDPDNGKHGNCFSAVLASLLHLPIESVPVFKEPDTWMRDLNAWLRQFGLAYVTVACQPGWFQEIGIKGMHHESSGWSPRFENTMHACVAIDGQVVFDVMPGGDGFDDEKIDAHGLFVCKEPWGLVEKKAMKELLIKQAIVIGELSKGITLQDPLMDDIREAHALLDAMGDA